MWGPKTVPMLLAQSGFKNYDTVGDFLLELHAVGAVRIAGKYKPRLGPQTGAYAVVWAWQSMPFAEPDDRDTIWLGDSLKSANEVTLERSVTP